MGVTLKRILTLAITLLLATPALAQTAPELFTFQPGTPIRADEMNANFQLLKDHVTNALGIADLTSDDLEELANLVEQLQTLAASGELHGSSLEYDWDGTTLGIKRDNEESFTYVNLLGATGPQGEAGPGLEYEWTGTQLGVRAVGQAEFDYVNLAGPQGPIGDRGERGEQGDQGEPGVDGAAGRDGVDGQDGADGRNIVFGWNGTQLGVGYEGETLTYVDIQGPQGIPGEQGPRGERGLQGDQGEPGLPGADGRDGADGIPGADGRDGAPGLPGADGRNLEFHWDGTQLGVRYEGDTTYTYVDLEGPEGPEGPEGIQGARGERGLPGPGLTFIWNGTRLGVKTPEDAEFSYANLQGDPGPAGAAGADGIDGADGTDGRTLLNGSFPPPDAIGQGGDFYIDTSTWQIYGPKTDTWGAGISLVGPAGEDGTNYTGGNGISIVNSVIGLTHFQTLPNCWGGEVPQSSGSGWVCAPSVDTYFGPSSITGNMGDGRYHECVLGDVWLTANTFGSATIADGRILSIAQNPALYSLLGSRYGGNGTTTFALPDLTHVSPRSANGESLHYVICTIGIFPSRD